VTNPIDKLVICRFLAQFKLLDGFAVEHRHLHMEGVLVEAKELGFVKDWEPPKGCTYYGTAICSPKGRLYLKKNT